LCRAVTSGSAPGICQPTGSKWTPLTESAFDGETYDRELPARQRATLY